MKTTLLTAAALSFAFAASAQADVPPVGQVAPGNPASNPEMSELPAVDEGTPEMNLPGMNTVPAGEAFDGDSFDDSETAPLTEGFDADGTTTSGTYAAPDRNAKPMSTADGEDDGVTIGDELDEIPFVGDDTDDDSADEQNTMPNGVDGEDDGATIMDEADEIPFVGDDSDDDSAPDNR